MYKFTLVHNVFQQGKINNVVSKLYFIANDDDALECKVNLNPNAFQHHPCSVSIILVAVAVSVSFLTSWLSHILVFV